MTNALNGSGTGSGPDVDAAALEHVFAVTKSSGTSFYWAMRLLPKPRREAMFAIYAFCREVDDIADRDGAAEGKLAELAAWRQEVDRIYDGTPRYLTAKALVGPVRDFALRRDDLLAMRDGMEMDVRGEMRAPTEAALEAYCRRVAGAVGLLSIRIFGAADAAAEQFAIDLGSALQLTNILRDLRQDAELGRLYLPREMLLRHGIASRDADEVLAHPALPDVCADLARQAEARFAAAEAALARSDPAALRPAVVMMHNYHLLLERLVRAGWRRLDAPVKVSVPEKLWIAFRYGVL
jgi:phytoene synthase